MQRDVFGLKSSPVFGAVIIFIFATGVVFIPTKGLGGLVTGGAGDTAAFFAGGLIIRFIAAALLLLLGLNAGFKAYGLGKLKGVLLSLPIFAVAVNNLPAIGLITGAVTVTAGTGLILLFAANCLCVALFEELAFRGLILPLVLTKAPKTKKGNLCALLITGAAFGLWHLVNLTANPVGPVLLQVCYTFLIGSACAVITLKSGSVWYGVLFHALFNFCGLLAPTLGGGDGWNLPTIILTIVIGIAAGVYAIWLFLKKTPPETINNLIAYKQDN